MITRIIKNKSFWLVIATIASLVMLSTTVKVRENLFFFEKAVSYVYVPIQKGLSYIEYNISNTLLYFNNAKALSIENENLKNKIAQLEEENRSLISFAQENERLKEFLDISDKYDKYDKVTCKIIAKDTGNWFNTFTIDKGLNNGIKPNMTVMTPKGLVGQTISSTPTSSKVMAIIDARSSVSVRLTKQRNFMIVRGDLTLKEQGLVKMNYIPTEVIINQGDSIQTSGIGGIFPEGIMIGRIIRIENDKTRLMRYAIVQPEIDFKRLEEVVVLKNKGTK